LTVGLPKQKNAPQSILLGKTASVNNESRNKKSPTEGLGIIVGQMFLFDLLDQANVHCFGRVKKIASIGESPDVVIVVCKIFVAVDVVGQVINPIASTSRRFHNRMVDIFNDLRICWNFIFQSAPPFDAT
jgi:hypothetical protein